jgi:hypothetical protein
MQLNSSSAYAFACVEARYVCCTLADNCLKLKTAIKLVPQYTDTHLRLH